MNRPSPALIAQSAVRRLPRLALLLFCVAYVLPGFLGRGPWKNADISALGAMRELLATGANWLQPQLLGQTAGFEGVLAYWLGAVSIAALPFLDPALAARLPFVLLLTLTLVGTWYAVYSLARSPQAQPVAFAFGGEASPIDYARAIADAGLLALIACLGLAQLSHETTPAVAQLGFAALTFFSVASSPYAGRRQLWRPSLALALGLGGLALSGAPTVAVFLGAGAVVVEWVHGRWGGGSRSGQSHAERRRWLVVMSVITVTVATLAYALDLWRWRINFSRIDDWRSSLRLLLWFPWPAWPLALWTLWRWRRQLASRHLALPLWHAGVTVVTMLLTSTSDRGLLLSLPAFAALAAFSLPTLKRSVASLIDWFTLLFFTSCALTIWVIWVAMQTGFPKQPAANVAKLAPGFEPSFSFFAFLIALAATLAWAWLVKWRAGRQRAAVWKSLVLPAGGTTLCWLLLMTLWLPLLDYARSYAPLSRQVAAIVDSTACVEVHGLSVAQMAAFQYHGQLDLQVAKANAACPYLVVNAQARDSLSQIVDLPDWALLATVQRPTDRNENVLVFRRVSEPNTPVIGPVIGAADSPDSSNPSNPARR